MMKSRDGEGQQSLHMSRKKDAAQCIQKNVATEAATGVVHVRRRSEEHEQRERDRKKKKKWRKEKDRDVGSCNTADCESLPNRA